MKEKRRFTLRISILSIYVITFIILISIIITIESLTFLNALSFTARSLLEDTSTIILQELKAKGSAPEMLCNLTKLLMENDLIHEKNIVNYSIYAAKNTTRFQLNKPTRLITWIGVKGNSVSTFLESDGTFSTALMDPSHTPPIHTKWYRSDNNQIQKRVETPYLDLRKSPRYQLAVKAQHFIWTDAFISYPSQSLTTSASTPIYDKENKLVGVFSIDIKLEGVSEFLTSLKIGKNGVAFIINGKGDLIAFPGMQKVPYKKHRSLLHLSALGKPWVLAALQEYKKTKNSQFNFEFEGETYIAIFPLLPEEISEVSDYEWKVGLVVPESDFTGELERKNIFMIFIGIIILLFGIGIASIFSTLVTTRLKMLVLETEKIKNFYFEGKKVDSIIKEVYLLANAIYSMKMNLHSFKKYLPANLVQQLIQSGQDINLGGDIRTLSIFFSDINHFTKIAETLPPDQLMRDLSEYLDKVSRIISNLQGTIDKFIGDSIMAFWSAPLPDQDHCEHACRAALACKAAIDELNKAWLSRGKVPFITRFGVHTGEVIVGNVGSKERMNYTALGDTINVTSRMEGLNKVYGTSIIASEQVFATVGHLFIFRKLDVTTIKGKSRGHTIYELLAEKGEALEFDLAAYQKIFEKAFSAYQNQQWTKAIDGFKEAQGIYPDDSVTPVFIKRCHYFMKKQPSRDWDGVWRNYLKSHE